MSLYYHVPDKAAVLRGVAELVLAEIQVDDAAGDHWIDALKSGFRSARRVLKAHPNVIPLLMISPGADRSSRRLAEIVLGLMAEGGNRSRRSPTGPSGSSKPSCSATHWLRGYARPRRRSRLR